MTTTEAVTGHASMQLYTLLQSHELKYLRNTNYLFFEPSPSILYEDKTDTEKVYSIKCNPKNYSIFDKLEIKGFKIVKQTF